MTRFRPSIGVTAAALLALAGCAPDGSAREAPSTAPPAAPRRIAVLSGFDSPESVKYDPEQDVYFVSNIVGFGSVKDNAAYIARVDAADPRRVEWFIRSGRNGVTLNAPKGMALQGDTLWVTDIDVLRGFHRRTGAPLATVDLGPHRVVMLNDLALGPDGSLYTTDSGIRMSPVGVIYQQGSRILVVRPDRSVSALANSDSLGYLNGLAWDSTRSRWITVTFDLFRSTVYALPTDGPEVTALAHGPGRFDGVQVLPDGRLLVTAWSDSSMHLIAEGVHERLIGGLSEPADFGMDTRRNRLAIPLAMINSLEIWELEGR